MRSRQLAKITSRDVLVPQWPTSECLKVWSASIMRVGEFSPTREHIPGLAYAYFLRFFCSIFSFTGWWWLVANKYQLPFPYLPGINAIIWIWEQPKIKFNLPNAAGINFGWFLCAFFKFEEKQLSSTPSVSGISHSTHLNSCNRVAVGENIEKKIRVDSRNR